MPVVQGDDHANGSRFRALESRPSRRSEITRLLYAAIVSAQLRPGEVYSAPSLAAEFGVSPTPVREAMVELANEGLVEIVRNRGFRVFEPSETEIAEIYEIRRLLEAPLIAKAATQPLSPEDLESLKKLADATLSSAHAKDVTKNVVADMDFHLALVALAGNQQAVDIVRGLRVKSRLFGMDSPTKAETLVTSAHEHAAILDRIRDGDEEGALRAALDHIGHAETAWRHDDV